MKTTIITTITLAFTFMNSYAQLSPAITSFLQNNTETGSYYISGNSTAINNNILVNCQQVEYSDNFVYILKPDSFGITGRVVAAFRDKEDLSLIALETAFDTARIPEKMLSDSRQHVRQGRRKGITWESQMPRADGNARSTSPGDRPHLQE